MSKTYWSQRIEELANSEKAVPDTAFFTSEAYRSYTETAAKDMITGVCGYLRRCGYSISEMEEDRRVNALAVEMLRNPEITAYTDGYNICIGTNNSLITSLDSRELRHYAIQGFRVHEVAHILFTDFPTLKNWVGHLNQGIWWPKIPDRASEKDGAELTKRLKKPRFCKPFVSIARNIENALEDGFIEREIQEMYGGLATTELATLDEVQISESVSFGKMLKQKCSPFEAMLNQILLYAKYDITMDEGIPDEYVQTLEDCVFVIDDVKYERNPQKRLEGVNEICCILYPLVADLIKELEKKPKQKKGSSQENSKSGSGICMPGQAQGSSNDQSQSQQGNGNPQSQPQVQNQQGSSNSQSQQGNATSDGGADSNSGAGGTENNADSDKVAGERLQKALEKIEQIAKDAIILSPRQAEAVRNLKYRISIVTGGPGTGKTTCLRAIMDVYHMVWPEEHILLMAPTGLAAKRMAESTGTNSSTIHKACGLVPANNPSGFTAQGDCTICGFIGIDEMSMVGEHLFAYAIDAVLSSPSTRIVLLGDTDQLAPVARGDVLRDLIKCGVIKTVRLDVNYRQGSTSTITDASIKIRENRAYTGNTRNLMFDDEFRFVPVAEKDKEKEANEIMNHIVEEYLNGVSKYGMEGTIVLTPTHYDKGTPSGYLCKNRVNAAIQAIVNPKTDDKLCVEIGKQLFMVGDRIIQRKNTEQVINGDLGTIQSIAQLESDVAVEIYFDSKGETLVYNNEDMKDIELAYAITVHSSQGCEFPCCIIPVSMTYGVMLTKPLYYTGITRAKKKLVMIGDEEALKYALQNFRKQTRKSLLGPRIITKLKKAKT